MIKTYSKQAYGLFDPSIDKNTRNPTISPGPLNQLFLIIFQKYGIYQTHVFAYVATVFPLCFYYEKNPNKLLRFYRKHANYNKGSNANTICLDDHLK